MVFLVLIFYNMWGEMSRGLGDFVGEIGGQGLKEAMYGHRSNYVNI